MLLLIAAAYCAATGSWGWAFFWFLLWAFLKD